MVGKESVNVGMFRVLSGNERLGKGLHWGRGRASRWGGGGGLCQHTRPKCRDAGRSLWGQCSEQLQSQEASVT